MPNLERRDEPPRREPVVLGLLLALGLLARLPGLGADLWLDEVSSVVNFIRLPLSEIVTTYVSANNHVLYSLLAHLAVAAFGETAWAVRLPAMLFGAATIPALYIMARRFLARREALAAALVLTVSYHHAYFSQNARGYTGLILSTVLTTTLLDRALAEDRARHWIAYALTTATAVYLLLSALFVCLSQAVGALFLLIVRARSDSRLRRRRLLHLAAALALAALLTLALYAPLLPSMLEFISTADRDVGWRPSLELLRVVVRDAAPSPALRLAALLGLPVAVAGLASLARRAPLVLFAFALPPAVELLVAMAMGVGTYPRRFLLVLPLVILVAVRGATLLASLAARVAARPAVDGALFAGLVAAAAIAAAASLPSLYRLPKQDYRGALSFIRGERAAGDLVAAAYIAELGSRYYDPSVLPAREAEDLAALLDRRRRIWLIGTFLEDLGQRAPGLDSMIRRDFEQVRRFPGLVGDGDIVVWRSRDL